MNVRTVPSTTQSSGTTLVASPAWIFVTEMTPVSSGCLLRVRMFWKACTIWQAAGIGSMPLCGIAACAPLPRIVILNSLLEANAGPAQSANCPAAKARPVVRAEDRLHRESLEQAVLDHFARAAAAFLGWLEDEVDRAVEVAVARQVLRGGEQHGRVAVVTAGVHPAGVLARVGEAVVLGHRQRIDVGAQADGPRRVAVADDADHAGLAEAAVHRDAPALERPGDQVRGALFLEAQFRVGMDVASHRGDRGGVRQNRLDEMHWLASGQWGNSPDRRGKSRRTGLTGRHSIIQPFRDENRRALPALGAGAL